MNTLEIVDKDGRIVYPHRKAIQTTINLDSIETIHDVEILDNNQLVEALIESNARTETEYFRLAALIARAHEIQIHKQYNCTWSDFVEKEIGIHVRKANYLKSIYDWFYGILKTETVREKVLELGWSKVKELVGVVGSDNIDAWVDKAKELSATKLAEYVRNVKKGRDPEQEQVEGLVRLSFSLHKEQLLNIESALQMASKLADSNKRGNCIDLICTSFVADQIFNLQPGDENLVAYFDKLQKQTDVSLVVFDHGSKKIIMGKDNLIKLVNGLSEKEKHDIYESLKVEFS